MAFTDQVALAKDAVFQTRVQMALVTAAIAILAEDPQTPDHVTRAAWARVIVRQPRKWVEAVALAAASNVAITDQSTDADLQFTINSQWNALAGVIA